MILSKGKIKTISLFIICNLLISTFPLFADDTSSTTSTTAEPYAKDEFPLWAQDMRRTEIISFGSLPFVTLGVMLGYGTYLYSTGAVSTFPNPLNKSSSSFTTDQQFEIIKMSCAISVGLGFTDLVINLIQRMNKNRRLQMIQQSKEKMSVTPLTPEEAGALLKENTDDNTTEQVQEEK